MAKSANNDGLIQFKAMFLFCFAYNTTVMCVILEVRESEREREREREKCDTPPGVLCAPLRSTITCLRFLVSEDRSRAFSGILCCTECSPVRPGDGQEGPLTAAAAAVMKRMVLSCSGSPPSLDC